jgi:sugar transferase (PEP-CTERM system associated)
MIHLFRVFVPVGTLTLLLSEILLVWASFTLATYIFLPVDPTSYLLYDGGLVNIILLVGGILVGLYFQDLYSDLYIRSKTILSAQLMYVMGAAFLIQSLVNYLLGLRMPLRVMLPGSVIAVVSIFLWRLFFSAYALRVVGRDRLLLVGSSPLLAEIASYVRTHPDQGLHVIGCVNDSHERGTLLPEGKLLGHLSDLQAVVVSTNPTRLVVGMSERRGRVPVNELLELRFSGHIIEEVAAVYERICGRVSIKELRPSQLIYSGELGPSRQTLLNQAIMNLIGAAAGVIITAPLMALVALAVKLTSPGPVLYRQQRVGVDGVTFTLYKFRSMRMDAEASTGAVWAAKDDPRVTAVGRIIRRIRFDELPQFFNVLKGEMSIVGPRPERPEFVKTLTEKIPYYRQRHYVRPGITGWAQISYKYGDTFEDTITKLEYDLFYIKNMSVSLDVYIIFHTLKAMLLSRGAQ